MNNEIFLPFRISFFMSRDESTYLLLQSIAGVYLRFIHRTDLWKILVVSQNIEEEFVDEIENNSENFETGGKVEKGFFLIP